MSDEFDRMFDVSGNYKVGGGDEEEEFELRDECVDSEQGEEEEEGKEDEQEGVPNPWGASAAARIRNQVPIPDNNPEGGDAGDEAEYIEGRWETYQLEHEDLTGIVDEVSNEPECCFLCEIFQSESEMENNQRLKQFQLMLQNSYLLMSRRALGIEAREVYNEFLRPYTKFKRPFHAHMDLTSSLREREIGTARTRLHYKNIAQYTKLLGSQNDLITKLDRMKESR